MSEQEEKKDIYIILPNFIDTGSLFGGMIKLRNGIESIIISALITIPIIKLPFTLSTKVILLCFTALPAGILALIGVYGESISSFVINFFIFLKNRRILSESTESNILLVRKSKKPLKESINFDEEFTETKIKRKNKKKIPKIKNRLQTMEEYIPIEKIENEIIYTKDKRFIKIIEVEPINFLLKSVREQRNIIYSFVSYLKISPVKLQFKVVTRKADINRHLRNIEKEIENEKDEKCKILQIDYANLIRRIGNREAITRRFFIVFEYEPISGNKRGDESEAVAQLEIAQRTAKNYLLQCGNEVITHENEDEFLNEVFYSILNRKTSVKKSLKEKAQEVIEGYILNGDIEEINKIPVSKFISPDYIDFEYGNYIVIDDTYYSYMVVPSNGYKTQVIAGWLSLLVNAGEGIDVDLFFDKQPKSKIQQKLGQQIRINRSKIREASDTNTDFDDLNNAIHSGYYLKEGISNNQDFYYISLLITITADSLEELEWRQKEMKKLMLSKDLDVQVCIFRQEQAFLSSIPIIKLDKVLFSKSKRNTLSMGAASCYPFTSFEMSDDNGILLGVNKFNNSLIIVDIFNSAIYKNANIAILGTTGAGKTFTMQLMALRMRRKQIQVFILAPIKGHEFKRASDNIGGEFIQISPASLNCINIMEIRKTDNIATEFLDGVTEHSKLTSKIQSLHMIFSLIIPDMNYEEKQLLDEAFIKVYGEKGITHDNKSLEKKDGTYKEMPVLEDVYNELIKNPQTKRLANILNRFVHGSASTFNQQTNVKLDNKYTVIDLSDVTGDMLTVSMLIALLFIWDKIKEDRTVEKAIFIPELWNLIGSGSNKLVANYVLEIFKTIRGFGGAAIADTQDLNDYFALEDGKYGEGILNSCKTKIILNLEDKEAQRVKSILNLSETEIMNITHFERGSGLISTNNNNVTVEFKASPLEKELITTDRHELKQILEKRKKEKINISQ